MKKRVTRSELQYLSITLKAGVIICKGRTAAAIQWKKGRLKLLRCELSYLRKCHSV